MKNLRFSLAIMMIIFLSAPLSAQGGEAKLIGTFGDWSAYVFIEDGNKVCYMASQPKKSTGNYTKRGDVFALITHRPAEGSKNVFSFVSGYGYKSGSEVSVTIDKEKFTLFTQDDAAWAADSGTDSKIAQSLRKGSSMVIKGVSSRGTATTDNFSLKGTGGAHDAIDKECNS